MHSQLSLLQVFQNALVLRHSCPYIGVDGLLSLAAASRAFRDLLFETPHVFQRVDLSNNKLCTLMVQKGDKRHGTFIASMFETPGMDGRATESTFEEYLARPLDSVLGHLTRLSIIQDVRVLILDGLAVPGCFLSALLCGEIKNDIRLLSLRGVEELSEDSLAKCLRYLIRSSRPISEPRLKGLYFFTKVDEIAQRSNAGQIMSSFPAAAGVTNSTGAQLGSGLVGQGVKAQLEPRVSLRSDDIWYDALGEVSMKASGQLWGDLLEACEGLIAFDATICRHDRDVYDDPRPKIANIRLSGCQSCGSCPEGGSFLATSRIALSPLSIFL